MQEWRLLNSGYSNGATNMATDEAIALAMAEGIVPPTIRFYGWIPACLSLGYAQKAGEVDWDICAEKGVEVVRRPTGGRAILHDREVTYSIIAREDNPLVSGSILESYLKISEGLLIGLRNLGVPAEMVSHKDLDKLGTAACFDSPSWYEIVVDGRKMVGSAQTRKNGIVLQHGSIIRDMDTEMLFSVLNFPSSEARSRMKEGFRRKACSLQEVLCKEITDQEVIERVTAGFAEAFGIKLVTGDLIPEEKVFIQELVQAKYADPEWNNKR